MILASIEMRGHALAHMPSTLMTLVNEARGELTHLIQVLKGLPSSEWSSVT